MSKCRHQFFETNKETYNCPWTEEEQERRKEIMLIRLPEKYGVRVVCALCGEKRQVWDDGEVNVWDKKKQIWNLLGSGLKN